MQAGLATNLHFGRQPVSMKNTGISKDDQPPKVLTAEQTRESLRLQKAMSLSVLLAGYILAMGGRDSETRTALNCGVFLGIVGGIWLTVTRVRIWWNSL